MTLFTGRPGRVGVMAGLGAFLGLTVAMQMWIHYHFEGCPYGPFLLTEKFGVAPELRELGARPVCFGDQAGWDGMYYYTQANDPFILRDDPTIGLDNPSYRYQRNGIPLVAWGVSRGLGYDHTPSHIYHLVQIAIVSLGFGVLAGWLTSRGVAPGMALCWLGSGGVLLALFHGLADAPADALFAIACVAVFARRLWLYTAVATLLLLCREGYAAFAAPLFLLSMSGTIDWRASFWKRSLLTALPGVILLAWTGYVASQLGGGPLAGARSAEPGTLLDAPLSAFVHCLEHQWNADQALEVAYLLASVFTLGVVLVVASKSSFVNPLFVCCLPLIVLTSMTGTVMWEHHTGHLKNNGLILIIGVLMLAFHQGPTLRFTLLLNLVIGLAVVGEWAVIHPTSYSPNRAEYHLRPSPTTHPPMNRIEDDFRSSVEVLGIPDTLSENYDGVWSWCHRPLRHYHVRVTNQSQHTWRTHPQTGPDAINLYHQLTDRRGRVVHEGRVFLPHELSPGETTEMTFGVRLPAIPGRYRLRVTVWQEGNRMFDSDDPDFGYTEEIKIP